jgi:hypothetical protein
MALKKLVDVGEVFPLKRSPRLGAAPPPADVLDNVALPDMPSLARDHIEHPLTPRTVLTEGPTPRPGTVQPQSGGRGIHTGKGIDARRQIRTGRDYQFGARTTVAFADEVKRLAAAEGVTIGELLDAMLAAYRSHKS